MIAYLVMIPIGYLLGAIPFGLILGKLFRGVDVREYGSGKTGMTNVMRTAGVLPALLSLALDMGKAVLAVVLARAFFDSRGAEAAAAIAAVMGHNWPVFVGFRGGRGTAPGWGCADHPVASCGTCSIDSRDRGNRSQPIRFPRLHTGDALRHYHPDNTGSAWHDH